MKVRSLGVFQHPPACLGILQAILLVISLGVYEGRSEDQSYILTEIPAYPPWPESPAIELTENSEGLLLRSPREFQVQEQRLLEFEKKFRQEIAETGVEIDGIGLALDPGMSGLEAWEDLVFARYGKRALLLDVYRPANLSKELPVVVVVHGGGWKKGTRIAYRLFAKQLAREGFVTVSAEYRLAGEAPFPAAVYDLKAAIRFMRASAKRFQIDVEAIGMCGGSAGGHLSLLTGYTNGIEAFEGQGGNQDQSSRLQAVASLYGGTDFCAVSVTGRGMGTAAAQWIAVPFREDPTQYILASPVHHVSKQRAADIPATLFVKPTPPEPWSNVASTKSWLEKWGIACEEVQIDAPHGFIYMNPYQSLAVRELAQFFREHLGGR